MDKVTFKEVGYNILKHLTKRGMTQQALADTLGISKQVMSKIISGAKAINVSEISRIAAALQTSVDSLLTLPSQSNSVPALSFMGTITCDKTQSKISFLNDVIMEILLLDDITKVE